MSDVLPPFRALAFDKQVFALVGACVMVGQHPELERKMWREFFAAAPTSRSIVVVGMGRFLAMARAISDQEVGGDVNFHFNTICYEYLVGKTRSVALEEVGRIVREYTKGADQCIPRVFPYQVVSYIHVARWLGVISGDGEEAVRKSLITTLRETMSPKNMRQFEKWAKFSDFARCTVVNYSNSGRP